MDKNFISLLFFSFCFQVVLLAQSPLEKQWDKRFGASEQDQFTCFIQTSDDGYLIGGSSNSGSNGDKTQPSWGGYDYWIVKTDSSGNLQWDKRFGGTESDVLNDVFQTADGGYILGGWSSSGISGDKTQNSWGGSGDYWIVKIDASGMLQWDERFGGTDDEFLASVQQTSDGGYALGGFSFSGNNGDKSQPSWGGADYWLVKTDSFGNMQWNKRYGGTETEFCTSMQQTADGGYILGGHTPSEAGGDKTQPSQGFEDYWIVKTDSLGNLEWDKRFGGTQADEMSSIEQTNDGGYILGGVSGSVAGGDKTEGSWGLFDYWIIKIDALGIKEWDKDLGANNWEDLFGAISQTTDGGYLASGTSYSFISGDKSEDNLGLEQAWIVKTDSLGIKQWDKTVFTTGHDEVTCAIQAKDGCYVIGVEDNAGIGGDKTGANWGGCDYWLVKFSDTIAANQSAPSAFFSANDTNVCQKFCINFIDQSVNNPTSWHWVFPGGSPSFSIEKNPGDICYNTPGIYTVTLITSNANGSDTLTLMNYITIHPTPSLPTIAQAGDVLTCSPAVSYQWELDAVSIPGATNQLYTITQTGTYMVTISDGNGCVNNSTIYLEMTGIESIPGNEIISVYPNPASDVLIIDLKNVHDNDICIEIYNTVGQVIYSTVKEHISGDYIHSIALNSQPKGVHFIHLKLHGGLFIEKIILE